MPYKQFLEFVITDIHKELNKIKNQTRQEHNGIIFLLESLKLEFFKNEEKTKLFEFLTRSYLEVSKYIEENQNQLDNVKECFIASGKLFAIESVCCAINAYLINKNESPILIDIELEKYNKGQERFCRIWGLNERRRREWFEKMQMSDLSKLEAVYFGGNFATACEMAKLSIEQERLRQFIWEYKPYPGIFLVACKPETTLDRDVTHWRRYAPDGKRDYSPVI